TLTANGTVTSPIVRGAWILENILGTPPPLPPPDVPGIEPDLSGATTIKQQLDSHRSVEVCASCHKKIDPLGFALESYDVIGKIRSEYRVKKVASKPKFGKGPFWKAGPVVEPTGRLSTGHNLNGPETLTEYLVEKRELFARCLTKKLMTYGVGRHLEFMDRPAVEKIISKMKTVDFRYPLQDLIIDIVNSEPFLTK
ncbi:MAG: DUF1588 domain-containing protein, partial [Lentisphaeraceae bacterium]|nr:DUF1588 domain-containing protein [Lentisphaeraceae bacterium]